MWKMMSVTLLSFIVFSAVSLPWDAMAGEVGPIQWSERDMRIMKVLRIENLPPLPKSPSNAYADNPKAVTLGEKIFYDKRFSANNKVACSNCHLPTYTFTDKLPLAKGMGTTGRRSMPFVGMGYGTYFFWDGRKDSLWSQALGPPESAVEHGISRNTCATLIYTYYREEYEEIFGPMPEINTKTCPTKAIPDPSNKEGYKIWQSMSEKDQKAVNRIFANMGKAIAAFVRRIVPGPARFDHYVEALIKGDAEGMNILTRDEKLGLKLFLDDKRGKCINCHNGPLLTNGVFHNVGVSEQNKGPYDNGRLDGIKKMQEDEFNCKGEYSDADPKDCRALNLVPLEIKEVGHKMKGAFKTPSLRNTAAHPPYLHDGSAATMMDVMVFYNDHASQYKNINLTRDELGQLVAFMGALDAPLKILPF